MAQTPVILRMEVHCNGCARKIRRVVKSVFGVQEVWVSVETGLVVVAGTCLDASLIRWRIQSRASTPVTVVSAGGAEDPPPQQQPQGYPPYYGGGYHHQQQQHPYGWVPAPAAPPPLLPYVPAASDVFLPVSRQYVPNDAPVYFNDDNPNGCCIV